MVHTLSAWTSRHTWKGLWPPAALCAVCWAGAQVNYQLFHMLAELFSVCIAFSALVVASTAIRYSRHHFVVFVSIAIGWCAGLDLLHALSFKGMGLLAGDSANPATQLWIAARWVQGIALLLAPLFLLRPLNPVHVHLGFGSMATALLTLISLGLFPVAYIDGQGLTPFKIYSEYAVIGMLLLGAAGLWLRRQHVSASVLYGMLAAIAAMVLSEWAFTRYVEVDDTANLLGHLLKIVAYWFVYLALVRHTVHEPFVKLQDEVAQRQRLNHEREQALFDLGERIKELRCLNAISELVGQPNLHTTDLLQGVAAALPPAFVLPDTVHVAVTSDWGNFGAALPTPAAQRSLSEPLRLNQQTVAHIHAWYPDDCTHAQAHFLPEEASLLANISRLVSEALEQLHTAQNLQQSTSHAAQLENRFEQVFQASPVPMQIIDLEHQRIRAINDAHQHWLGYALEDISTTQDWFNQVYPDPQMRSTLATIWQANIEQARHNGAITSPELQLRCKCGTLRTAQGTMTVIGNDAIVAWHDLTAQRAHEKALIESERRFRHMVEDSASAMFVRRNGRYIYANRRFTEITGWSTDALLGQEVLQFTDPSPDNIQRIEEAWRKLHQDHEKMVSYVVPFRHADGQWIQLALTASILQWDDGQPASVVLAADVTESERSRVQIQAYVQQLEASMRATLQAVSNMIEMRDPYTAGHERRVGLLAAAIAKEMGWSDERCAQLELLGLVHDIGKIAVPAEILSKPARLNPLEMELIKGHAQAGYDILKDVPFPMPVAEVIRQHHERLDGSGYPRGLKGEEILPEARILAVADVIESIASHRPYRPAKGLYAGLSEVTAHRGTHFDPKVVDAATHLLLKKGYTLPE